MRLPLAALAVALVAAIGFVPLPAIGAAAPDFAPDFALSCGSATAGTDVPCTISRASAGKGLYVLFETADGTAHAGVDYTAVRQLLYFKASALSQTVAVHTALNPDATGTLTFTAAIAASTLVVRTTGWIVEPPPLPIPPSPPSPTPIPSAWVPAPLAVGGFAFVPDATGPVPSATPCCNGLIVKVVAQTMSTDVVPVPIWWVSYFTDTRGEVANPDQFRAMIGEQSNLQGVAPAP